MNFKRGHWMWLRASTGFQHTAPNGVMHVNSSHRWSSQEIKKEIVFKFTTNRTVSQRWQYQTMKGLPRPEPTWSWRHVSLTFIQEKYLEWNCCQEIHFFCNVLLFVPAKAAFPKPSALSCPVKFLPILYTGLLRMDKDNKVFKTHIIETVQFDLAKP